MTLRSLTRNSLLLTTLSLVSSACPDTMRHSVGIAERDGDYVVTVDGELFTQYLHGEQKPFLYPVIGPTGINMTREFPMKKDEPNESQDHPWHSSVYYAHGSINGFDFWNERTEEHNDARIELIAVEEARQIAGGKAQLIATHSWNYRGRTLMTDRTEIVFSSDESSRTIDYSVTLLASEGDVTLGDTKEGCMAVRMHPKFRVKDQGAQVVNSEGDTGASVWGKNARWISYSNEIAGETLSISMLDHPRNFRYPTPWHARDYGLCAANPFGLSHFNPDEDASGETTLRRGESLSFSYRLIFHKGSPQEIDLEQLHQDWTQQ